MAAPKRSDFERENDYRRITDMYLQGKTQAEIASVIGLAQQQVSYDLAIIQRRWKTDTAINLDEAKQKELSRIDTLERTYWDAWEHSAGEHTKTRTEQALGILGDDDEKKLPLSKVTTEVETLLGVPAFLSGVMSCIERRCKLLGLDAPTKIAPTNPAGDKSYENGTDLLFSRIDSIATRIRSQGGNPGNSVDSEGTKGA